MVEFIFENWFLIPYFVLGLVIGSQYWSFSRAGKRAYAIVWPWAWPFLEFSSFWGALFEGTVKLVIVLMVVGYMTLFGSLMVVCLLRGEWDLAFFAFAGLGTPFVGMKWLG